MRARRQRPSRPALLRPPRSGCLDGRASRRAGVESAFVQLRWRQAHGKLPAKALRVRRYRIVSSHFVNDPKHWQERAEEMRVLANDMKDVCQIASNCDPLSRPRPTPYRRVNASALTEPRPASRSPT